MRTLPESRGWTILLGAVLYGLSPVDLVPDAVPFLGVADDLGVLGLAAIVALAWWHQRGHADADDPWDGVR